MNSFCGSLYRFFFLSFFLSFPVYAFLHPFSPSLFFPHASSTCTRAVIASYSELRSYVSSSGLCKILIRARFEVKDMYDAYIRFS